MGMDLLIVMMVTERWSKKRLGSKNKGSTVHLMLLWVTTSLAINKLEGGRLRHFETRQRPDVVTIMFSLTSH